MARQKGRKVPLKIATVITKDPEIDAVIAPQHHQGHGGYVNGKEVNVYTGLLPEEGVDSYASYAATEQHTKDLNLLKIQNHDGPAEPIDSAPVESGGVTVYFRDLEARIVEHIRAADGVLGCVAWLTNKAILAALATKDPVAIVVQKEDFLRPDIGANRGWPKELRRRYDALGCTFTRYELPMPSYSSMGDPTMSPVRCAGNYNRDKNPAFPRMHHKFILFCRTSHEHFTEGDWQYTEQQCIPYAVWTGSFNLTENAGRSLENAIYITNHAIVEAYTDEWARIEGLSEPLDWESDWVAPEWRLGT